MSCGLPDLTEGSAFMRDAIRAHEAGEAARIGRSSENDPQGDLRGLLSLLTSIVGEDKVEEIKRRVWTERASDTARHGEFVTVNSIALNQGAYNHGVDDVLKVIHYRNAGNAVLIGRDPEDGQYLADFTDWQGKEDLVWLREEDFVTSPQEIELR